LAQLNLWVSGYGDYGSAGGESSSSSIPASGSSLGGGGGGDGGTGPPLQKAISHETGHSIFY